MKRTLIVLLVAVMALSLAACSSGGGGATQAPVAPASSAPASSAPASALPAGNSPAASPDQDPGEVIPMSLFIISSRVESAESQLTKDYIRENQGIELEAILANDNWQQKYSLLVSGGDIPTVSLLPPANYYEYADQGAYTDLTNLVNNYPVIMNYVPEKIWPRLYVNDALYGVPNMNVEGKYVIVYRKDWLDKLGLEAPTTIDEFTEVMRAFSEDDPDGNGQNDTYGFGTYNLNMFYGAFGGAPGFYHKNDAGQIEIGSISEGYKNALMYYKDLYAKKYIEPEVPTQKEEQFWQKLSQGKFGAYVGWWSWYHMAWDNYDFKETQIGGELITTRPVTGPDGKTGMVAADPLSSVAAISYKVEDPDPILRFFEWAMSNEGYRTMKYGVPDLYWEAEGDELTWHNGFIKEGEPRVTREGKEITGDMEVYSMFQRMDIYLEALPKTTPDTPMPIAVGFEQAKTNPQITNLFIGLTSSEFQLKMPDISKYVDEMRIKFILGEESFDNWDSYVKEYIRLGGMEVAESLLKEYNDMHGESAALIPYQ